MKRLLGTAIVALFGLTMAALSAGIECDDAEMVERSGQVADLEAGMPLPRTDANCAGGGEAVGGAAAFGHAECGMLVAGSTKSV